MHRQEVDLAQRPTDLGQGFAKVGLGMAWRMRKRHEHLLGPLAPARYVILHDRHAAGEAVLVTQPLEDPLRRMALLLGPLLVGCHDRIDDAGERIELGPKRRLRAHIPRRHREPQHLGDRPRINPEPLSRCTPARSHQSEPRAEPSRKAPLASSPSPRCRRRHWGYLCRTFTPAQPNKSAASVRDYCSGFYTSGCNGLQNDHTGRRDHSGWQVRCLRFRRNILPVTVRGACKAAACKTRCHEDCRAK